MKLVTLATPSAASGLPPFVVISDNLDPEEQLALAVASMVADVRGLLFPQARFAGAGHVTVEGSSPTGTVTTQVSLRHLMRFNATHVCPRCEDSGSWVATTDPLVNPTAYGCFSCGWVDAGDLAVVRAEPVEARS